VAAEAVKLQNLAPSLLKQNKTMAEEKKKRRLRRFDFLDLVRQQHDLEGFLTNSQRIICFKQKVSQIMLMVSQFRDMVRKAGETELMTPSVILARH
jgi:hypothetical protein